jgi:hypothetical protein
VTQARLLEPLTAVPEGLTLMVKRPIFIVGVGRSGSTIFHRMFSEHPNVAWLSTRLCDQFPDKPSANRLLMEVIDYPIVGRFLRERFRTGEGYRFWEYHCPGFRQPCRDLVSGDVTHAIRERIPAAMSEITTSKRSRLLLKITGWPRIDFLREIFNDAIFINVVRDGRAVVNSMINVDWWWGWRGPQNWRWGELTPLQREEWDKHDRSFIALASIEWKILMDAMDQAKRFVNGDNIMALKYEDLCSAPVSVFKGVVEFCGLEWSREFEASITRYKLRNTNYKWQNELTSDQQQMVQSIIRDQLELYGYL